MRLHLLRMFNTTQDLWEATLPQASKHSWPCHKQSTAILEEISPCLEPSIHHQVLVDAKMPFRGRLSRPPREVYGE